VRHSVSSLSTWWDCPRKWAWKYVEGLLEESAPSAARGIEAHELLARYLNGEELDLPPWIRIGLPLLPQPKTCQVEERFYLTIRGIEFQGAKDVQDLTRPIPFVSDHKTTKHFRRAKSANKLRTDPQAALYAADAMIRTGADQCDIQWTYFLADPEEEPNVKPVVVRLTRADVAPVLERMHQTASEIESLLALEPRAIDFPPNPEACEMYMDREGNGKCPFIERCNLTAEEKLFPMTVPIEQVMASVRAVTKGINPPPLAPAEPAPPRPTAAKPPPPPPPPAKSKGPPPLPVPAKPPRPDSPTETVVPPVLRPPPHEETLAKSEWLTFALYHEAMAKFCRNNL
jgi:PD-(D/E)XK nuclease superfamily